MDYPYIDKYFINLPVMLRILSISGILIFLSTISMVAQDTIHVDFNGQPVDAVVQDGDTLYIAKLEEAVIEPRNYTTKRDMRQYRRLIYNVKVVYPYAKLAGQKFVEINRHLSLLKTNKERKEYIKNVEDQILKEYEADLKNLTITQGRILIKLIDRETSQTSFEVVKDLRGSFQATFWQAIARLFGSNLKTEFDPQGEDKILDEIMVMIENGEL
jgi:hypothetical protein